MLVMQIDEIKPIEVNEKSLFGSNSAREILDRTRRMRGNDELPRVSYFLLAAIYAGGGNYMTYDDIMLEMVDFGYVRSSGYYEYLWALTVLGFIQAGVGNGGQYYWKPNVKA